MLKHTFFAIGLGLTVFILYLLQYTGAFKSVTIGIDQRPDYIIVYQEHTGAYHQIVKNIEVVEKWLKSKDFKCRLSFGEFFDDPRIVEEGRLKSRAGCLIDPQSEKELTQFSELKKDLPADFKTDTMASTKAVVALFNGAPGIGPMKVYPKAEEFIAENKLTKKNSVIEIYEVFDERSMQTTYIWPIQ